MKNETVSTVLRVVRKSIIKLIISMVECLFGFQLGATLGWCGGWYIGNVYQNTFEPIHLVTFEVIRFWYYLPYTCAQYGIVLGGVIGVVSAIIISKQCKRHRILDLYRKGITRPYDLAKVTGLSQQKVNKILMYNY